MTRWPEPFPVLLETMWRQFRGADAGAPPPLPDLSPADAHRAPGDPFWSQAFVGFLSHYFKWAYISAGDMARHIPAPSAASPAAPSAAPAPVAVAATPAPMTSPPPAPTPAAMPAASPIASPVAEPVAVAAATSDSAPSSSAEVVAPAPAVESAPAPTPGKSTEPGDPATIAQKIRAAAESVPKDARTSEFFEFVKQAEGLNENPLVVVENPGFVRAALALTEQIVRFSVVLPALEDSARKFVDAIDAIPGVVNNADEVEEEHVPSAARPGQKTRVLRRGYRSKDGSVVVKPRVQVSSRELSDPRAQLETFSLLAEAIEKLAPQIDKSVLGFLRRAADLIDSHAHGDPRRPEAVNILRDCVKFATEIAYYYAIPECATVITGLDRAVDCIAEWLRDNGVRIFPSVAQPFREGKPAPAPFPQTVLKEVPDPAPEGALLRIRQRGLLREGKIEQEPIILISRGTRKGEGFAKGLNRMAIEARRMPLVGKKWADFIERTDELLLKHIDAPNAEEEAKYLRFLLNHVDEMVADGPMREASNAVAKHLSTAYPVREIPARAGGRVDDTFDTKEWEFERKAGSDAPPNTILHVARRAFKDANTNLLVQKGKLIIS